MPAQLSKFTLHIPCKDYTHPWTSSCVSSTAGLGLHAFQESLRIYTTVYLVTLLLRGKKPTADDIKKTVLGILQSSAFLSWSGFAYSLFICTIRRYLGHFNILTVSFIPSFLSSLTAILIERSSRRTLLCLYVTNIATETLFRMGLWRGYYSKIPYGEIYIFGASISLLLYFYRTNKNKKDSIYKIFKVLVGPYESFDCINRNPPDTPESLDVRREERTKSDKKYKNQRKFRLILECLKVYQNGIKKIKNLGKHRSCPHPHSCVHYVLQGGSKSFTYGLCAQLALKIVFQLKRLIKQPKLLKSTILRRENLRLAACLGGFTATYRLTSCCLRRLCNADSPYFAILAGLLSSPAFALYPDNTVALYVMWKALQLLWNDGVESGNLPEVQWFNILLYCFSTATLFHAAIIEPHNLRPSYWKFLYNLSGGRIATMCRIPLDEFGLESSRSLQETLRKTHTTDQITYSF